MPTAPRTFKLTLQHESHDSRGLKTQHVPGRAVPEEKLHFSLNRNQNAFRHSQCRSQKLRVSVLLYSASNCVAIPEHFTSHPIAGAVWQTPSVGLIESYTALSFGHVSSLIPCQARSAIRNHSALCFSSVELWYCRALLSGPVLTLAPAVGDATALGLGHLSY